jgi:RNA polymerase-binding transcription factor DksA
MAKLSSKKKAVAKTSKPVAKKPAAKPVVKKAASKKAPSKPVKKNAPKPAAPAKKKVVAKKEVLKAKPKAPAKPAKKAAAKPKPVIKVKAKATAKPVKKAAPSKPLAKAKPIVKKAVAKTVKKAVAPKPTVKKAVAKPVAKTTPKVAPKKAVLKVAAPKSVKQAPKKEAPKPVTKSFQKPAHLTKHEQSISHQPGGAPKHTMEVSVVRYSDADLVLFKEVILKKIAKAKEEIDFYSDQIKNSSESETQFASIDDGSMTSERENMNQIVVRMQKLISHLESALVRIENKSYGICRETGRLIPKERLLVVPHATLSVEGKKMEKK